MTHLPWTINMVTPAATLTLVADSQRRKKKISLYVEWNDNITLLAIFSLGQVNYVRSDCVIAGASLVAKRLKHLPARWETQVRSAGQEDSLEKEMATHSSTLAWKISWMGSLVSYSPWNCRVVHDWATSFLHIHNVLFFILLLDP